MNRFVPSSSDIPSLYRAAHAASSDGQKRFLRSTRSRLILLAAAATCAVTSWRIGSIEVLAILSAASFGGALVIDTYLAITRPEKSWYEGRAVAESVKSLMWRFMVGGQTFGIGSASDGHSKEKLFIRRCQEIVQGFPDLHLPPGEGNSDEITEHMLYVRSLSFKERRERYIKGRLEEQIEWYGQRSRFNKRNALIWMMVLLGLEFTGLVAAILRASGVLAVDVLGILSAVAAGCIAWTQAKRYHSLSAAYAVAYHELAMIRTSASVAVNEGAWESYVDAVEDAILRENNLWGASRPAS
ncbi:DUF4231 domain-containing protein [Streptosporangium sp. NPDC004379]|uniref:DUF4231 domain-containing protein n=1 Tax=Streptosporangium sp. NPDC004379 TaxID=3366189 RepID=UPI0036CDBA60